MPRHLLLVLAAAAACATTPPPAPTQKTAEDAPPPPPPFALSDLTVPTQSLLTATLRLEGKLNGVSDRELTWSAKAGDQSIGSGKTTIDPGADGTFTTDLSVKLADTLTGLEQFKSSDSIDVVVHASLSATLQGDRAISLRTPQPPEVVIRTVQSERTGPANIGVIFYVSVKNPNSFDLQMDEINYKAMLSGKPIGTGTLPGAALPASASTEFDLQQLEANTGNCGAAIHKLIKEPSLDWGLNGAITLDGASVPFDLSGQVKLSG